MGTALGTDTVHDGVGQSGDIVINILISAVLTGVLVITPGGTGGLYSNGGAVVREFFGNFVGVLIFTDLADVLCITLGGTGGLYDGRGIGVGELFGNIIGILVSADLADILGITFGGAGGFHDSGGIGVCHHFSVVTLVLVTAHTAGVHSVTFRSAGGSHYGFGISMGNDIGEVVGITVAAGITGMLIIALGSAGRGDGPGGELGMAGCVYTERIHMAANAAFAALDAFFRTGGGGDYVFFPIVVAAGNIIGVGHGIFCVEFLGAVIIGGIVFFRSAHMIGEAFVAEQEPLVLLRRDARIPGSIQVVVLAANLCDVPAVGFAVAGTGNQTAVKAQLQCQTVNGQCIALAYGGAVDEGTVSGELGLVGGVVDMGLVIGHIGADVIIDSLDLVVIGIIGDI